MSYFILWFYFISLSLAGCLLSPNLEAKARDCMYLVTKYLTANVLFSPFFLSLSFFIFFNYFIYYVQSRGYGIMLTLTVYKTVGMRYQKTQYWTFGSWHLLICFVFESVLPIFAQKNFCRLYAYETNLLTFGFDNAYYSRQCLQRSHRIYHIDGSCIQIEAQSIFLSHN